MKNILNCKNRKLCPLCGKSIADGGKRSISQRQLSTLALVDYPKPASLQALLNELTLSTEDKDIDVCWSGCPLMFSLLAHEARQRLDQGQSGTEVVIDDHPFDVGYMTYDSSLYDEYLEAKRTKLLGHLSEEGFVLPLVQTFPSPSKWFRQRCRLGVHVKDRNGDKGEAREVTWLMWDSEGIPAIRVHCFPIASALINSLMRRLKAELERQGPDARMLCEQLMSVNMLSTLQGSALVTFIYRNEKGLSEGGQQQLWRRAAQALLASLASRNVQGLASNGLGLIAVSKGVNLVEPPGRNFVEETLTVRVSATTGAIGDSFEVSYVQPADGFSNPNAHVNQLCLGWLCECAQLLTRDSQGPLLELYCGAGNHTMALSRYFPSIICVELNKALCGAALVNLQRNGVTNVKVLQGPSAHFARRIMRRNKSYIDTTASPPVEYCFNTVLVDPPRGGLDKETLALLGNFDNILYISCNPKSLVRDLTELFANNSNNAAHCDDDSNRAGASSSAYRIERFAVFDHFAYSKDHLESAVLLRRDPQHTQSATSEGAVLRERDESKSQ